MEVARQGYVRVVEMASETVVETEMSTKEVDRWSIRNGGGRKKEKTRNEDTQTLTDAVPQSRHAAENGGSWACPS